MDNDIMIVSKEADAPVSFTITVKDADGTAVASGNSPLTPIKKKCI